RSNATTTSSTSTPSTTSSRSIAHKAAKDHPLASTRNGFSDRHLMTSHQTHTNGCRKYPDPYDLDGQDPSKELRDSLLTACDNSPLEAVEIGSQAREPGDVYDVLPLLAMPLRLLGAGRNSMAISWRIVTIAADDELVTSGELKLLGPDLLDQVRKWAGNSDFGYGEIAGPVNPRDLFSSPSLGEDGEGEAWVGPSQGQATEVKSEEQGGSGTLRGERRQASRERHVEAPLPHAPPATTEATGEGQWADERARRCWGVGATSLPCLCASIGKKRHRTISQPAAAAAAGSTSL
ncbi:hypothetical protein CLOP_g18890, partial [Closterium sp. NIES-67]